MKLSLEGDVHLRSRLTQGSFVSVGGGGVEGGEGVDVDRGATVVELRPRRNYWSRTIVNEYIGAIRM